MAISYPFINGHRHDWSSVQVTIGGIPYTGVKSINYNQKLTPGTVRGTRAQVTGRTRGQYECEGSIEIYKEDYQVLVDALSVGGARGYMETPFQIIVQYGGGGIVAGLASAAAGLAGGAAAGLAGGALGIITDTLAGVRLASDEDSPSESGDPMTVSCDLSIMYILRNGKSALAPDQLLR